MDEELTSPPLDAPITHDDKVWEEVCQVATVGRCSPPRTTLEQSRGWIHHPCRCQNPGRRAPELPPSSDSWVMRHCAPDPPKKHRREMAQRLRAHSRVSTPTGEQAHGQRHYFRHTLSLFLSILYARHPKGME
jgi:hypothetical protein